jgi:spore cortex formation protein SpoVR/YcgB (stage V sporulation)
MSIFIPVLWICINAHCEFMQQNAYFRDETECKSAVDNQKTKIRKMAAGRKGSVKQLEGTCVEATIDNRQRVKDYQ